jgi:hypothetical protein
VREKTPGAVPQDPFSSLGRRPLPSKDGGWRCGWGWGVAGWDFFSPCMLEGCVQNLGNPSLAEREEAGGLFGVLAWNGWGCAAGLRHPAGIRTALSWITRGGGGRQWPGIREVEFSGQDREGRAGTAAHACTSVGRLFFLAGRVGSIAAGREQHLSLVGTGLGLKKG